MNDGQMGVIFAFIFGVIFVTALLAIVVFIPIRRLINLKNLIILALAAGGVAAMIPGFLNLKLRLGTNLAIRAGGALAVFAVVYFYSPAHWVSPEPPAPNISQKTEGANSPNVIGNGDININSNDAAVDKPK